MVISAYDNPPVMQYTCQKEYLLYVAGLERTLPIIRIEDNLWIASFVMLGDTQLNNHCAGELVRRLGEEGYDTDVRYLITPEAKSIPLAQVMSDLFVVDYVVLRKGVKSYMEKPLTTEVKSITTAEVQKLVMDGRDV